MPLQLDSSLVFRPHPGAAQRESAQTPNADAALAFARALEGAGRTTDALPSSAARHVAAQRTPLSGGEAAEALSGAWQRLAGQAPSDGTLSVLVGQWAHETGRGNAMLNFNFGGIKGTGPSGASTVYRTREGSGASEVQLQDRFRAYDNAEQGASDYLSLLSRRYPDALQAAGRGDAVGFVQALKERGYFTGDEAAYTRSVASLAKQALSSGFAALSAGGAANTSRAPASAAPLTAGSPVITPQAATLERASALSGGAAANVDSLLLAAHSLHSPEPLLPGAWAHALADEVTRVDLLISALQIGQLDEKEEG